MKLKKLIASLAAALVVSLAIVPPAFAWNPFGGVDCGGKASSSAVCQDGSNKKNPLTGSDGLLSKVANIIAVFAGMAAVIIIILAGLRFVTSSGSSEEVAGARRAIIYASIGLVVIVLARALISLVLNGL